MSDRGMVLIKLPVDYGIAYRRFNGSEALGTGVHVHIVTGLYAEASHRIFVAETTEQARGIALGLAALTVHGEPGVYEVNDQGLIVRVTTPS